MGSGKLSAPSIEGWFKANADARVLGFSDVVAFTGIEARQLRNGIDRKILAAGEKHRSGRWQFTLRECFYIAAVAELANRAWVPISQASEIAAPVPQLYEAVFCPDLAGAQGLGFPVSLRAWDDGGSTRFAVEYVSRDGERRFRTPHGDSAVTSFDTCVSISLLSLMEAIAGGLQSAGLMLPRIGSAP
jgi:hypothetical protein